MKLSVFGLALTAGIVWGAALLLVGLGNLMGSYGGGFLQVMDSLYPGYHYGGGFGSVIVGTIYALVDGAICGGVFAWLYNKLS